MFFTVALVCTSSKAGICTALGICGAMALYKSEHRWWLGSILAFSALAVITALSTLPMNDLWTAGSQRLDIWQGAYRVYDYSGWRGIGMGMFPNLYNQLKLESYSSGNWVHNDTFQIAIEMGTWAAISFISMFAYMYWTTRKGNIAAAAVLTAILVQSMVEFQFYVPAVSLLGGLAFAYHSLKRDTQV
jgi:hypothetical protein